VRKKEQQEAVKAIRHSYQVLSQESDLSPANVAVTETLTHLVRTLTKAQSPELARFLLGTSDLTVERDQLPLLCGQAECEMEKFWSRKLISGAACELADFWYFPEYTELCRAEIDLFKQRQFKTISFLGSGALPITAYLLARHCPDTKIKCIDFDCEATHLARELGRKIGLGDQIDTQCMDALKYEPEHGELVICASLLQGREQIYKNLDRHECALIVRDSEGPYQYLYKPAELPQPRFRQIAKTTMNGKRINTSRYYEQDALLHAA
jgi:hypothetical protein